MNLTYKEMLDTFIALKETEACIDKKWGAIETFFKDKKRFIFIGCGSSYSLAKSMAIMTHMGTGLES